MFRRGGYMAPRDRVRSVIASRDRLGNFAHEFRTAIDEAGVELDEACAGVELGDGVLAFHDAADADDRHFAGIRERVDGADVPAPFRGVAISMVTAGLMSLAFMGFAGLDKYQ